MVKERKVIGHLKSTPTEVIATKKTVCKSVTPCIPEHVLFQYYGEREWVCNSYKLHLDDIFTHFGKVCLKLVRE